MGSLPTHFAAFLILLPVGLRRLISSVSLYLRSPSHFRASAWYLSDASKWRNLDLYALLVVLPLAAFSQLFFFLTLSPSPSGFSFFHHSALLLLFWLLSLCIALRDSFDFFLLHENLLFLLASTAFLLDYSVTRIGAAAGLGAHVYALLAACTLVCACSCILLSIRPAAFFADVALSAGMVLKATWSLQVGLSLFSDSFVPEGCKPISSYETTDVDCLLDENRLRGLALVDLLFVVHVIGVFIAVFAVLAWSRSARYGNGALLMAGAAESEGVVMRQVPELELD